RCAQLAAPHGPVAKPTLDASKSQPVTCRPLTDRSVENFRKGRAAMRTRTRSTLVGSTVLAVLLSMAAAGTPARAADPVVVATYDFEDGTAQGWFARGSSAVAATTAAAHGGTQS